MNHRWYRSRLFWIGIPGFLFLLWLWGAFLSETWRAGWRMRSGEYSLICGDAYVAFRIVEGDPGKRYNPRPLGFYTDRNSLPASHETLILPPAVVQDNHGASRFMTFYLANWYLALSYAILWLGGLAIWQLRKQRKTILLQAMRPDSSI